jgi:hypothetical protein
VLSTQETTVAEEMCTEIADVADIINQKIRINISGPQLRQAIRDFILKNNPKIPKSAEIYDISIYSSINSTSYVYLNNSVKINIEKDEYGVIKSAKRRK